MPQRARHKDPAHFSKATPEMSFTRLYHILGKALCQTNVVPLLHEVSHCERVLVCATASKTLICHVEERIMFFLFHHIADLLPLILCRIDAGRIVCTGVEEDNAGFRCGLEIRYHSIKIQSNGILVVIAVFFDLQSESFKTALWLAQLG